MKHKCCDFLLHEIAFYKDSIRPCCSFSIEGDITPFINNFNGSIEDFKKYLKKRENFINIFESGQLPVCFEKCTTYIPTKNNNKQFKLNNLIISNFTKCSCNCIYCEHAALGKNKEYKKWLNNREAYDIKPMLIFLRENNYIEKNCRFLICGGECTEYPKGELEWLIYFCKICDGNLLILSSGIVYSKSIENALKSGNSILKISIDSGTKKTFEKIKRVKAYEQVWNNIKKYIQNIPNNNSRVELKYIIIPGVNDNIKEINAFLKKAQRLGCKNFFIDVEHEWIKNNKNNLEKHNNLKKLLNYIFKYNSEHENIRISFEGVQEDWLWSLVDDRYNYKKITK